MALSNAVVIETAFDDNPFAASPTWTGVSDHVESATADAGAASIFNRYKASTLDVSLNNTDFLVNPLLMNRWKQVRMRTVTGSTPLAHCHLDLAPQEWGAQAPFKYTAQLECVDGVGLFARRDLDEEPIPGGSVTSVLSYLFTLAGLPAPTFVGMSSMPIARIPAASGGVLEIIQDVLDTESGFIVHQPQDGLLALEVRGRYAPLVAWQDYLDNGLKCVFTGAPDALADPPQVGILRGSMPMVPVYENYRDEVTVKGTVGNAYTQSVSPPTETPQSTFSRTEMLTANRNWLISSADMWLKMFTQVGAVPRQVRVLCATPVGPLPALDVVKALRFGDVVGVAPLTIDDITPVEVTGKRWELTRQSLHAVIGITAPFMSSIYGGIDDYAAVGSGVVGTSKVAP